MSPESLTLTKLAGLMRSGVPISKAIGFIGGVPEKNLGLRYLLELAMVSGSGVANELDVVAELCYQREQAEERIKVAYAGPKASSALVIWMPVITMGIAQLSGFDLIGEIRAKPVLGISILFGAALLFMAKALSGRFIKRAAPKENFLGYYLMGVALITGGGSSLNQAQDIAYSNYKNIFGSAPDKRDQLLMAEISNLVETTGARVGDLLKANARNLQREVSTANELQIEKLSVKLMLPLGLAVLPAFICLAVIPLMATMFGPK